MSENDRIVREVNSSDGDTLTIIKTTEMQGEKLFLNVWEATDPDDGSERVASMFVNPADLLGALHEVLGTEQVNPYSPEGLALAWENAPENDGDTAVVNEREVWIAKYDDHEYVINSGLGFGQCPMPHWRRLHEGTPTATVDDDVRVIKAEIDGVKEYFIRGVDGGWLDTEGSSWHIAHLKEIEVIARG